MKQPLAYDLKSRDGDTGQDQRLVNAFVDVKRGIPFVSKRPALEAALEIPVGTGAFSTLGQALYVWQEVDVDSTTLTTSVVGIRGDSGKKSPATKALLYFTTQPSNASLNTAISPAIVVTARDKFGNTKTDFTGNVTLSFATNRYAATLGGTLTVAAVAGVATFSNVTLNRSGIGFALRATATGAKPATSNTFDLQTVLSFTTMPTVVAENEVFSVVVKSVDSLGTADPNYTGDITLELIPSSESSVITGTLTRTAVAGVATFTGLSISVENDYGFVASGTTVPLVCRPTAAASALFTVGGYVLVAVDIYGDGTTYGKTTTLGSITPSTYGGLQIRNLYVTFIEDYYGPGSDAYETTISTSGAPAQTLFTTITINGTTFTSASATFASPFWSWVDVTGPLVAPGTYSVTFT